MELTNFLHFDTDSQKLKADQKMFWVGIVKKRYAQSGHDKFRKAKS